jgi:Ala-tRNA(Pro) deacylase
MNVAGHLTRQGIPFDRIDHRPAYTAKGLSKVLNVPEQIVAKTVLIRADHGFRHFVVVLPADRQVDLNQLSQALGGASVELADEKALGQQCPDCEFGVLPPFGSLYGMLTIVDASLADDEFIVFEGNTHQEAIRTRFADYRRIENPLVIPVT